VKEPITLPEGQRQKKPQIKDNPVLPEGGRAKQGHAKEMITLPEGQRGRQPQIREFPTLPEGNKEPSGPDLKDNIQIPQQSGHEVLTGGINGLVDPISPVSRQIGFLSSVKNLIRADKTGAETRPGRAQVGDKVGSTRILGLATLYTQSGAKKLVAGSGTGWKVYNPTPKTWDSIKAGLTADTKFEGACIDDLLILTNGKEDVQKYDGSNVVDLGGSPPKSPFIAVGYRRVFLVDLPHQLAACNPGDPTEWTGEDSATISINAKDGDTITWIQFYGTNLYIWKRHSLHELHGPELGYVSANWRNFKVANVGTPNGRTIAGVGGALFWLSDSPNNKGIVAWTGGGSPQLISDPIKGIIDRINWDNVSTAAAGTDGEGNYLLSVPLDSATTPTHTIVYCTLDGSWWLWEGWVPTVYGNFRLSTDEESYLIGDNTGYVYSIGGNDDAGSAINYEAVIGPAVLGSATQEKRVRRAYIVASGKEQETFTLDLDGATGGNFTLSNGKKTTANIAYNASVATIQAALETVYSAGNVTVTAGESDFTITFDISVGASNLVADFTGLTGPEISPTLTHTCRQVQAATSSYDIGAFDSSVNIDLSNTRTNRVKKYLPLNTGDPMGGYLYRLKLSGNGRVKFYEVGFEVGVRRV